jgi:hypothetical protein
MTDPGVYFFALSKLLQPSMFFGPLKENAAK